MHSFYIIGVVTLVVCVSVSRADWRTPKKYAGDLERQSFARHNGMQKPFRQMDSNFWQRQLGALQSQLFPYPETADQLEFNRQLGGQMDKVVTLAENDFIFGLRPYLKSGDDDDDDDSNTEGMASATPGPFGPVNPLPGAPTLAPGPIIGPVTIAPRPLGPVAVAPGPVTPVRP